MNFTMKKVGSLISFPPFLFFLKELRHVFGVLPPLVNKCLHVSRQWRVKPYHLLCLRMHETESLGMEGLTRQKFEAVLNELTEITASMR